jgi:hypothetical protein
VDCPFKVTTLNNSAYKILRVVISKKNHQIAAKTILAIYINVFSKKNVAGIGKYLFSKYGKLYWQIKIFSFNQVKIPHVTLKIHQTS